MNTMKEIKDPRQELFSYLYNEHNISCLENELDEIIRLVNRIPKPTK